jgi:uncharacterized protein YjiS (DUF1127 family)
MSSTGFSLNQAHPASQSSFVQRVLAYLSEPVRRFTAINELNELSDRQFDDIGVDRRDIEVIAERELARLRER